MFRDLTILYFAVQISPCMIGNGQDEKLVSDKSICQMIHTRAAPVL